jgi:GNAT superfamily N-acetyltransferase
MMSVHHGATPAGSNPDVTVLRSVSSDAEWESYHAIRERVLWEARGRFGEYDRDHPDEHADGNHPLLLLVDGEPVGVIRVDVRPPIAWFRRVAVREDVQRRGHGRAMLELAMDFSRERGCFEVRSNVDPEAVTFYQRLRFAVLDDEDAGPSVGMSRDL